MLKMKGFVGYPEGPVKIALERTPCHAASKYGNIGKLQEFIIDV
jgi:hypothetical protein